LALNFSLRASFCRTLAGFLRWLLYRAAGSASSTAAWPLLRFLCRGLSPSLRLLLYLRYVHIASVSCRALCRGIGLDIPEKLLYCRDGIVLHHAHVIINRNVLAFQNRNDFF
jgi:hypothetical protein